MLNVFIYQSSWRSVRRHVALMLRQYQHILILSGIVTSSFDLVAKTMRRIMLRGMSAQSVYLKASILWPKSWHWLWFILEVAFIKYHEICFFLSSFCCSREIWYPVKEAQDFFKNYKIVDGISNAIILLSVQIEYSIVSKLARSIFVLNFVVIHLAWVFGSDFRLDHTGLFRNCSQFYT